jgi:hypothetical protein
MMHREIGLAILALGICVGLVALVIWVGSQLNKAQHRADKRELHDTLSFIPVSDEGWTWPEGEMEQRLLGDDWYDPVADADAFIERMRANTQANIAKMRADTEAMMARPLFDDQNTITMTIEGRQDE